MVNSQTYSHRKLLGSSLIVRSVERRRKRPIARVRQFLAIISLNPEEFYGARSGTQALILGRYVDLGVDDVNLEKISCFSLVTC